MRQIEQNYSKTTKKITVSVFPAFLPDQSLPEKNVFVWAYTVKIQNESGKKIKLTNREWNIVDSEGNSTDVIGEGVVGEHPVIEHGKSYEYTSGTFLNAPSGIMKGKYKILLVDENTSFYVDIPMFSLDSPFEIHKPC